MCVCVCVCFKVCIYLFIYWVLSKPSTRIFIKIVL